MGLLALWLVGFVLLPLAVGFFVRAPTSYWVWLALMSLAVVSQASVDTAFVVPVLLVGVVSIVFVLAGTRLRRRRLPH